MKPKRPPLCLLPSVFVRSGLSALLPSKSHQTRQPDRNNRATERDKNKHIVRPNYAQHGELRSQPAASPLTSFSERLEIAVSAFFLRTTLSYAVRVFKVVFVRNEPLVCRIAVVNRWIFPQRRPSRRLCR